MGRARGNTWGYQKEGPRSGRRLNKFLYTENLEVFALSELQDVAGKIGRLGIGCTTDVEVWLEVERYQAFVRNKMVERTKNHYYTDPDAEDIPEGRLKDFNG